MKPHYHVASSIVFSGILYLFFKSWSITLMCFLSGILIDIDHIYDYLKEVRFRYKVLHSWELLFLIGIIAWYSNWNPWIIGILIGVGHHVVLDKLNNGKRLRTYSFIWRWSRNFESEVKFPSCAMKKKQKRIY